MSAGQGGMSSPVSSVANITPTAGAGIPSRSSTSAGALTPWQSMGLTQPVADQVMPQNFQQFQAEQPRQGQTPQMGGQFNGPAAQQLGNQLRQDAQNAVWNTMNANKAPMGGQGGSMPMMASYIPGAEMQLAQRYA